MKKSNLFNIVLVLTIISLVSAAVLTLANDKFSPIIKARENDKLRIVAQKLLPEGAQITKVANYSELASLVAEARKAAGLSPDWHWNPDAAPVEATLPVEEEKVEIDFSGFTFEESEEEEVEIDFSGFTFEENDEEDETSTEEETADTEDQEVVDFSDEEFSFAGTEFGEVSFAEEDEEAVDLGDMFGDAFNFTGGEEAPAEAPTEPAEEEVAPAFEIYQALESGKLTGVAVIAKAKGYHGDIVIMLSLDATLEKVIGMDVVQQTETAGLGSLITEEKFTKQFAGKPTGNPFETGKDIQGVAGATISSRGVATALQNALKNLEQFLIDGTIKEGA